MDELLRDGPMRYVDVFWYGPEEVQYHHLAAVRFLHSSVLDDCGESSPDKDCVMAWTDAPTCSEMVWTPRKPGHVAFFGINDKYVVGVMQTVWFRHQLRKYWHMNVVDIFEKIHVKKVYCFGNHIKYLWAARNRMKVYLDDTRRQDMRYSRFFCKDKGCAIKTFLYARRKWKVFQYDPEH
ncbi:hypothetical protein AVEN_110147-1 [Araneus ventricosus]|uniref:Uncharacterized protein n=1 Tax=Araneus ventricosus TaxID=182803 RepID=A0A4Y2J1K1_ARAVE|nr:hypothetical protein AVEN_110147-1 [Araneus ventricosus]